MSKGEACSAFMSLMVFKKAGVIGLKSEAKEKKQVVKSSTKAAKDAK